MKNMESHNIERKECHRTIYLLKEELEELFKGIKI